MRASHQYFSPSILVSSLCALRDLCPSKSFTLVHCQVPKWCAPGRCSSDTMSFNEYYYESFYRCHSPLHLKKNNIYINSGCVWILSPHSTTIEFDCFHRRRRRRHCFVCLWSAGARVRSRKRVIDIIYMLRSVSRTAAAVVDAGIPKRHRRISDDNKISTPSIQIRIAHSHTATQRHSLRYDFFRFCSFFRGWSEVLAHALSIVWVHEVRTDEHWRRVVIVVDMQIYLISRWIHSNYVLNFNGAQRTTYSQRAEANLLLAAIWDSAVCQWCAAMADD